MNRKLANKHHVSFRVAEVMEKDRYLIESIKSVRNYKRIKAVVVVEFLRQCPKTRDLDHAIVTTGSESE